MNFNEIQELIKLMNKSNLTEFKLKEKDFEILIRTEKYHKGAHQTVVAAPPQPYISLHAPAAAQQAFKCSSTDISSMLQQPESTKGKNIVEIKSPIVGTFYRSSGPDKPVFVK
jgi:acetyl-CoA carboxylase biotin carboxyl carrier protein